MLREMSEITLCRGEVSKLLNFRPTVQLDFCCLYGQLPAALRQGPNPQMVYF